MQVPQISVIIPTLNEEEHIRHLIEKLLPIAGVEIIVSDGGSTDLTPEICRSYPIKFIYGEAGRGKQMNRGVQLAEGDIFLFLHADSDFDPTIFPYIMKSIDKGGDWGCCIINFDQKSLIYRWLAFTAWLRAKFFSSCYGDQGIFCTKKLFFQVGGFPELPILEDLIFSRHLRCRQKGKVLPVRITTSARRFQTYGVFFTIYKMQMAKLMYYLGRPPGEIASFYRGKGGVLKKGTPL